MEKRITQSIVSRKRGRPAGRNRVPLSLGERRARNAQYERERRVEMTDALADLAATAGCEVSVSNADLLATVIAQLRQASKVNHSSDLDTLRQCNANFQSQVEELEARLAESDGACSASVRQKEVGSASRPVPERSPPECAPPPVYVTEQQISPGAEYTLETVLQELGCSLTPESICSPEQGYQLMEPLFPVPTNYLPVQRVSSLSESDHQSVSPDTFNCSSYSFAGDGKKQLSPLCLSGSSHSPSPYMFVVPEMRYGAAINQEPTIVVPDQRNVLDNCWTTLSAPLTASISLDIQTDQDPYVILSTEDLFPELHF